MAYHSTLEELDTAVCYSMDAACSAKDARHKSGLSRTGKSTDSESRASWRWVGAKNKYKSTGGVFPE